MNLVISPLPVRGIVVTSSPCWPVTRRVVSPSSMVTVWPAWLKPTWMRWRATWMPPRLETFRWLCLSRAVRPGVGGRRVPRV